MPTTAGYIRASTDDQVVSGLGLDAQRRAITSYVDAFLYGNTLTFYEDHASGSATNNRPKLSALLDNLADIEHLIVLRLDRLARNTLDLLTIVQTLDVAGVALHSVRERIDTSGPSGRFFLTMLAAMAEFETELLSQRTREALAAKRARGGLVGRPPLGFTGDPLRPDPKTIHIPMAILALREDCLSLRAIAARLSVPTSTVRYVLSNPIYRNGPMP